MTDLWDKLRDILDELVARVRVVFQREGRSPSQNYKPPPSATNFRRLSDVSEPDAGNAIQKQLNAANAVAPELTIDAPVYAIGDIHGRADLLKALLQVVFDDCKTSPERPHLVFLGDYIDRGFQSNDVISTLIELGQNDAYETTFLKGNHEQAMLHFLQDHNIGPDWAAFGGRETLISYNVVPPKSVNVADEWKPIQEALVQTIPKQHVEFLEQLMVSHQIGPYGFVHAGVKPGVPYEEQTDEDRMWIREEFLNAKNKEDLFIVHGHSPVDEPYKDHRRVNVDTGAYFTGRLTAVKIQKDKMSFLTNKFPSQESK